MSHGIARLTAFMSGRTESRTTFVTDDEALRLYRQFLRAHGAPQGECTFLSAGAMSANGERPEETPRW